MADLAIQILAAAIPKAVAVVRQLTKAKTNKKHFELLAERIQSTAATLEKLKEQGVPIKGVVRTGLNDFISVLDSANDLLNDYEFSSKVKRVVKANNLRDKIRLMNERLSHAQQNLNFALCVEQRSPSHTGNTGMNLMSWQEGKTSPNKRWHCCVVISRNLQIITTKISTHKLYFLKICTSRSSKT